VLLSVLVMQNPLDVNSAGYGDFRAIKCSQIIPQAVKNLSASCNNLIPIRFATAKIAAVPISLDSLTVTVTPVPFSRSGT